MHNSAKRFYLQIIAYPEKKRFQNTKTAHIGLLNLSKNLKSNHFKCLLSSLMTSIVCAHERRNAGNYIYHFLSFEISYGSKSVET